MYRLYIHPDEIIDCTAFRSVCPGEAIFTEIDLPAKWNALLPRTAQIAAPLPSPQ